MSILENRRFNYADYITWDDKERYELIDGIVYAMASPSQAHQEVSREISGQLWQFLRGKPCKLFTAPFDVRLNAESLDDKVVQPDLLVVCDKSKLDGKSVVGAPDMIIEILSSSNAGNKRHDKVTKFRLYQKAGVREYWIIDPESYTADVYILENGKYIANLYNDEDIVPVHVLEGCEINLADVFDDLTEE